jgi:hypothetical protein
MCLQPKIWVSRLQAKEEEANLKRTVLGTNEDIFEDKSAWSQGCGDLDFKRILRMKMEEKKIRIDGSGRS